MQVPGTLVGAEEVGCEGDTAPKVNSLFLSSTVPPPKICGIFELKNVPTFAASSCSEQPLPQHHQ
jgi:hypothetical protein